LQCTFFDRQSVNKIFTGYFVWFSILLFFKSQCYSENFYKETA